MPRSTGSLAFLLPIKDVVALVEVDYDAQQGKVLQVAGLEKVAMAVMKAVEQALKTGR